MTGPEPIVLSTANTRVAFSTRWFGASTVQGTFDGLRGELLLCGGDLDTATLAIEVDAASVRTGIALRDHHLAGPDFLKARDFPLVSFRSDDVRRRDGILLVSGELTLRGVTRRVTAACELRTPEGGHRSSIIGLVGRFTVRRRAHGVGVPGGLRRLDPLFQVIADEVQVTTEILVPSAHLLPALLPVPGR